MGVTSAMHYSSHQILYPKGGSAGFCCGQPASEPDAYMAGVDICWEFLDRLHPSPVEHPNNAARLDSAAFITEMAAPMPWLQDFAQAWQDVRHLPVHGAMELEWLLWQMYTTPAPADVFDGLVRNEYESHMMEADWVDEVDEMDETGDLDGVDDVYFIDAMDEMDIVDEMDEMCEMEMVIDS